MARQTYRLARCGKALAEADLLDVFVAMKAISCCVPYDDCGGVMRLHEHLPASQNYSLCWVLQGQVKLRVGAPNGESSLCRLC